MSYKISLIVTDSAGKNIESYLLTEMTNQLTPRERQAARMASQCRTNKEIADAMSISTGAAKQYLHRAFEKLEVSSRYELIYKTPNLLS